jgi:hypothetical protein
MSSAARVSGAGPSALAGWTAGTWTIDPAHTKRPCAMPQA